MEYTCCMKRIILTLALTLLCFGSGPRILWAEDILPPPESNHSSVVTEETMQETETTTDLNKELSPGSRKSGEVHINTYIREDDKATLTEYSVRGHVYMVKVEPVGGFAPYYLYDDKGDGTFTRRMAGGYKHLSPPEWVIHRF